MHRDIVGELALVPAFGEDDVELIAVVVVGDGLEEVTGFGNAGGVAGQLIFNLARDNLGPGDFIDRFPEAMSGIRVRLLEKALLEDLFVRVVDQLPASVLPMPLGLGGLLRGRVEPARTAERRTSSACLARMLRGFTGAHPLDPPGTRAKPVLGGA